MIKNQEKILEIVITSLANSVACQDDLIDALKEEQEKTLVVLKEYGQTIASLKYDRQQLELSNNGLTRENKVIDKEYQSLKEAHTKVLVAYKKLRIENDEVEYEE